MKGEIYVRLDQVSRKFGEEWALKEVSVQLERGKIYGIAGNNGSGKTVFMKCICGLLPVTSGRIWVGGKEIGKEIDFPESLGVIIETPGFLSGLTGRKNLEILAALRKKIDRKGIEEAMKKVGLDPDMKKQVSKYSLGMRQRLGIAQAIMENPEFLVLDEPFNGLDHRGVEEIRKLLKDLKKEGKTMILASHNAEDIKVLCDEVYEMDAGKLKKQNRSM
ncbi:MAG: ABC transporter ATP-binding protein [Eubacteriales bacterium]|nr:ABC transporter ATP-binding protein [Eubacteriales bacterium]